jgi:sodium/bile acid cotransporter 7
VLALGVLAPRPFLSLSESGLFRNVIVASVLFLMALPLETRLMLRTIQRPWAALLGSVVNMGLLPLLAWAIAPLATGELSTGILVASVAPCTLASAAVWTRRAGGNDAVAILVTILTNATCFLMTPMWLALMTETQAEMDTAGMIIKLGLLVVAPMTFAQLLRLSPRVARAATDARHLCSTLAQCGILTMILVGAVQSSRHITEADWQKTVSVADLLVMQLLVVAMHLLVLWMGLGLARALNMPTEDQIAVAFSGSQKTLMVGLYVAINYFGGLVILPIVSYHVGQLIVDTLIADRWAANRSDA